MVHFGSRFGCRLGLSWLSWVGCTPHLHRTWMCFLSRTFPVHGTTCPPETPRYRTAQRARFIGLPPTIDRDFSFSHANMLNNRGRTCRIILMLILTLWFRHIKPFLLPVDIQRTPCPRQFLSVLKYRLRCHKTTTDN